MGGAMDTNVEIVMSLPEAVLLQEALNSVLDYLHAQGYLPEDLTTLSDDAPLTFDEAVVIFDLRESLHS